jgi:hypothetical protein
MTDQWDEYIPLEDRVACLESKVEGLVAAAQALDDKVKVARAAEQAWRVFHKFRGNAVFMSAAGEMAQVPMGILSLLMTDKALDLEAESVDGRVRFKQGQEVLADIPASLATVLVEVAVRDLRRE